jgi:hypothetical protein
MPERRSVFSQLSSLARASNNLRAAPRGPGAYAKRVARRRAYGTFMGATLSILRLFGLSK